MIGCNYWASNAGTEMWCQWDESAIREDMEILSAHGIEYLRVFPNWRDFQPIIPVLGGGGVLKEYRLEGDRVPTNPYYLDEVMLERFSKFCEICDEFGMKLVVGLVTGWMSGRLFIPSVLFGKNLYSDSTALYFQQKYVQGFVEHLKHHANIYAWDLGNECNSMCGVHNEHAASVWTGMIANAIRAKDSERPIVSGMHGLVPDADKGAWTINGQAEHCDILTTHPYPLWVQHTYYDKTSMFRTLMHATCETKYYSDLGMKPCLVEEIGTMGPMLCDDEMAADFMKLNLFSNWANGASGVMWWCANEQTQLMFPPYTQNMCEVELGMIDANRKPKPVLIETGRVAKILKDMELTLPKATEDAVCILTKSQDQWGVSYMTYCLARQAGLNLRFVYCNQTIPESNIYLVPSTAGIEIMPREQYVELKQRVAKGAKLYISNNDGIWADFQDLTGLKVRDSGKYAEQTKVSFGNSEIWFNRSVRYETEKVEATVLAYDDLGIPAISEHAYGKGKVFYINFPLESMLVGMHDAFGKDYYKVYAELFKDEIGQHVVQSHNPNVAVTLHKGEEETYCVAINYSSRTQILKFHMNDGTQVKKVYYGELKEIKPYEMVVFSI